MTTYRGESIRAAIIMGGLHHCVANLPQTLATISSMLRPGGLLLMSEPNRDYVLEGSPVLVRSATASSTRRTKPLFFDDALLKAGAGLFKSNYLTYFGGPAFFLCTSA
jgi:hypothetical protein